MKKNRGDVVLEKVGNGSHSMFEELSGIQEIDKEICQDQRQRTRLIVRVVPKTPIYTIMKVPKVYGIFYESFKNLVKFLGV